MLNILYVTNEEIRRNIQAAIAEYDDLMTLVTKRKLRWFGYVFRSSGLAKMILLDTMKGKRGRGRQKKRWEGRQYYKSGHKLCYLHYGSWKQDKMEREWFKFICGVPTTLQDYGIE